MDKEIEKYLDVVMAYASLARQDTRKVRAELKEHLHQLLEGRDVADDQIFSALTREFGEPRKIGEEIAKSKGRLMTYLKKKSPGVLWKTAAALVLAFGVRYAVAESFYVPGTGAAPLVPVGSRVLVYKLARSFDPGDVIVFRVADGSARVGIVKGTKPNQDLIVSRNGQPDQCVEKGRVVGRVFLNTR